MKITLVFTVVAGKDHA